MSDVVNDSRTSTLVYRPVTRRLAVGLGCVFVGLGIAETIRDINGDQGGLMFWFLTLCGGGAIMLTGILRLTERPGWSLGALTLGAMSGALATAWTVVGPVASITLIAFAAADLSRERP